MRAHARAPACAPKSGNLRTEVPDIGVRARTRAYARGRANARTRRYARGRANARVGSIARASARRRAFALEGARDRLCSDSQEVGHDQIRDLLFEFARAAPRCPYESRTRARRCASARVSKLARACAREYAQSARFGAFARADAPFSRAEECSRVRGGWRASLFVLFSALRVVSSRARVWRATLVMRFECARWTRLFWKGGGGKSAGVVAHQSLIRGHCTTFWLIVPSLQVASSFACSVASLSLSPDY